MSALKNVNFNIIRYANCWEDADMLLNGLQVRDGEKVLSICSAGDNSFSLLTADPECVIAVDVNPLQIYLSKLKLTAIQKLEREEYLSFAGFRESTDRNKIYSLLRADLDTESRNYWDLQEKIIRDGICHAGKFENYFRIFSQRVLKLIHRKKTIDELFRAKSEEEQKLFYEKHWNNLRWRLLFRLFFSKPVMGSIGRDPAFLKEVKVPVGKYIFDKAEIHLRSKYAQDNFMLHYQLKGRFGESLPHYVQTENYKKIKGNLGSLIFTPGYFQDGLKKYGTVQAMNLSDIFEYSSMEIFRSMAEDINNNLSRNGRVAYWNLMVPRNIANILPQHFDYLKTPSSRDKGFFYKEFIVNHKYE